MTELAIETKKLSKIYRSVRALVDCDLTVERGQVFGLLGPNGAGKTTLLRTLLGFLRPSSGSASICGFDCVKQSLQVRRHVAYLPGDARLYRAMRGRDVIDLFSGLQTRGSASRSIEIAKRLELDLSRRVMFMSTGMRQKLAIAIVLGSQAPIIVLDEPTANLDPTVRSEVVALVREAHGENRTIVLSSHIFSDIEETCDAVAILKQGSVVGNAQLGDLQRLHIVRGRAATGVTFVGNPRVEQSFVEFVRQEGSEVQLQLSGVPQLWLNWLSDSGLEEMRIENAGVRAFYERFHAPKLAASV